MPVIQAPRDRSQYPSPLAYIPYSNSPPRPLAVPVAATFKDGLAVMILEAAGARSVSEPYATDAVGTWAVMAR